MGTVLATRYGRVAAGSMLMKRLSKERRSRGFSQTEIARRMGTAQTYIVIAERGDRDVSLTWAFAYVAAIEMTGRELGRMIAGIMEEVLYEASPHVL